MDRISYKGFNNSYATFKVAGNLKAGDLVSLDDEGNCIKGVADEGVFGVCAGVRDGYATVQLQGYMEAKFTGEIEAFGLYRLVYDSTGGVKSAGASDVVPFVRIVMINDNNSTLGFII